MRLSVDADGSRACPICSAKTPKPEVGRPHRTCGAEFCVKRWERIQRGRACMSCGCPLLFRIEQVTACCDGCRERIRTLERQLSFDEMEVAS